MWIVASDGHSHEAEGQMSTSLFFSKPGKEGDDVSLSKLIHEGGEEGVIDDRLYQTLWVMHGSVPVMSIRKKSNMC